MSAGEPLAPVAWRPRPEEVAASNLARLMRTHGFSRFDELLAASTGDPEWFWDAVIEDLGIEFDRPPDQLLDLSDGPEWARWFGGGLINLATACVVAPAAKRPDQDAFVCRPEDGPTQRLRFAELRDEVAALAAALRAEGVRKGDAVGLLMPMIPELAVAFYATAAVGAVVVPVFSGFAAAAVAERFGEAEVVAILGASGAVRRGRTHRIDLVLEEVVKDCPTVRTVVLVDPVDDWPDANGFRQGWEEFIAPHRGEALRIEPTEAEDPVMIIFTSGTTGRPKGVVHVHGGFLVKVAAEVAYQLDVRAGDSASWVTDIGWIMGPWLLVGAHALGAGVVALDGAPDWPDADRLWRLVESERITALGVSPTLIRALSAHGDPDPSIDLSSLRTFGSSGEPWNPEPYRWLMRAGGGRVPIINLSGGTEVAASFLSCHPVESIRECSLGGPALGMDMDVFDPAGRSVREEVGELVCKSPWPGMTRGLYEQPDRYLGTYWSTYPGVWRHGDWAYVDGEGNWFLRGRSDDVLNVAGKRLGPAEIESAAVAHPAVIEAAAIGIPDEIKGEAIWCFCSLEEPPSDPGATGLEVKELIAAELGRPFSPSKVEFVDALPKTRSGKILRRGLRAAVLGEDLGDLSSVENPDALQAIASSFR